MNSFERLNACALWNIAIIFCLLLTWHLKSVLTKMQIFKSRVYFIIRILATQIWKDEKWKLKWALSKTSNLKVRFFFFYSCFCIYSFMCGHLWWWQGRRHPMTVVHCSLDLLLATFSDHKLFLLLLTRTPFSALSLFFQLLLLKLWLSFLKRRLLLIVAFSVLLVFTLLTI